MADASQYTPVGVILNREQFAHALTVGSGPWRRAVVAELRQGYGIEDISVRMKCRVEAVREEVAALRRLGLLVGIVAKKAVQNDR